MAARILAYSACEVGRWTFDVFPRFLGRGEGERFIPLHGYMGKTDAALFGVALMGTLRSGIVHLADNSTVTLNRSVGGRFRTGATGPRGRELNQHVGRSDESAADEQARSQFLVRIRDGCPRGKPCGQKQREQTREDGLETINQSSLGCGDVPLPTIHQHVAAESAEQNQDAEKSQR